MHNATSYQLSYNATKSLKRQMRKYYANANILLRKFSSCSPDVKCCIIAYSFAYILCYNVLSFNVAWQHRYKYEETKNCLQQWPLEVTQFAQYITYKLYHRKNAILFPFNIYQ